ncbi:MAG: outer membrane lipoprotein-sorting protein [Spirochaetales bacterium]|nr:outer membrane lipoprotein-sorting protein [Spirochaetales bacterium]
MTIKRSIWLALLVVLPATVFAQMTAEEVVRRLEKNEVYTSSKSSGKLLITNQFGTKTKTFTAASQGAEKLLLEFTNKEERGQKILRLNDQIFVYYPRSNSVVSMQGGALKDSIFGSDFTYEDLTGEKSILNLYKVEFAQPSTETVDGVQCYHLRLTGITSVAYPFQELWVETARLVRRKAVFFSLTREPLKEMEVKETKEVSGKIFPSRFVITDLIKKNSSTEFALDSIQINPRLDARQFSLERLKF